MMEYNFYVYGTPVAKGSAKAFFNKKSGKAIVIQTNREKQKPWASMISVAAIETGVTMMTGPVLLTLWFSMPRPKSHYRTGKLSDKLKAYTPYYHTSKPDLDKLIRCVKDALTGIAWRDDSQVCFVLAEKFYCNGDDRPGVNIIIERSEDMKR
jgi:Holliday junction resolvase RusA-like endonuclease